jgi:hypothetical protein
VLTGEPLKALIEHNVAKEVLVVPVEYQNAFGSFSLLVRATVGSSNITTVTNNTAVGTGSI